MAIEESCPQCGASVGDLLSPGLRECGNTITWTEPQQVTEYATQDDPALFYNYGIHGTKQVPVTKLVNVTRSRVCGHVYELDVPMTNIPCAFRPGGKSCGAYAVGVCSDCQDPVCRYHGSYVDGRLLCDSCKVPVEAMLREEAAAAAVQAGARRHESQAARFQEIVSAYELAVRRVSEWAAQRSGPVERIMLMARFGPLQPRRNPPRYPINNMWARHNNVLTWLNYYDRAAELANEVLAEEVRAKLFGNPVPDYVDANSANWIDWAIRSDQLAGWLKGKLPAGWKNIRASGREYAAYELGHPFPPGKSLVSDGKIFSRILLAPEMLSANLAFHAVGVKLLPQMPDFQEIKDLEDVLSRLGQTTPVAPWELDPAAAGRERNADLERHAALKAALAVESASYEALPVMGVDDWLEFLRSDDSFTRIGSSRSYVYRGRRPVPLTIPQVAVILKAARFPQQKILASSKYILGFYSNNYAHGWVVGGGIHRFFYKDGYESRDIRHIVLDNGQAAWAGVGRKGLHAITGPGNFGDPLPKWKADAEGMTSARGWLRGLCPWAGRRVSIQLPCPRFRSRRLSLVEVTIGLPSGGLRAGAGGCGENACSWPFPLMMTSPWWRSCGAW